MGLAPEQGKGIEYEFDLLVELDQKHIATVTKDRTGKFQDETIEKPGEDFGIALYDWLSSGKAVMDAPLEKEPAKSPKPANVRAKPKPEKPSAALGDPVIKEQGDEIIKEIGGIITASKNDTPYFSEDEKEGARKIIKSTKLDDNGISDLKDFKTFLSEELAKRESQKAA